jgi:hypothetical protein
MYGDQEMLIDFEWRPKQSLKSARLQVNTCISAVYRMPSLSPSNLSVRQTLLLTALTASLATTAAILSFQALRREHRTERLKKQVGEDVQEWERMQRTNDDEGDDDLSPEERVDTGGKRMKWKDGEFDEGLIREQVRCLSVHEADICSSRGTTTFWARSQCPRYANPTSWWLVVEGSAHGPL